MSEPVIIFEDSDGDVFQATVGKKESGEVYLNLDWVGFGCTAVALTPERATTLATALLVAAAPED